MGAKSSSFPIVSLPPERVVIVTGGNRGIGYQTAKWVAMMGATVILACRSVEAGCQAIKKMNEEYLDEKKNGRTDICDRNELSLEVIELDLASLESTMTFINKFKDSGRDLHALVCNAGIAWHFPDLTSDGYERQFQVNYLSHFLICAHFLPIMKKCGTDCRIVLVSSFSHADVSTFDPTHIQGYMINSLLYRKYNYTLSKLYQVMQCYSMSRFLEDTGISICSADPGTVITDIDRNMQDLLLIKMANFVGPLFKWMFKTPFEGAKTVINCVVDPELKCKRSVYFADCRAAETNPISRQEEKQRILFDYTINCLKDYLPQDFPFII